MLLENVIMFSKIANEKSISKVAQSNHISQPALSQQMQRLEEELGVKLLERSNRGIELTNSGRILQKYALQFEKTYQNLKEEIDNLKFSNGTFRIAASPVACNYAIPCILYKASKRFPKFTLSLTDGHSSEIVTQVLNNQIDLGFVVGKTDHPDVTENLAFVDKIYLIAKKNYQIRAMDSIRDLKRYPLIMLNKSFSSYRLVCGYLKQIGCSMDELKISYHLNTTEALKSAVSAGHGLAFLPYMAIKKELYSNEFKIIEIPDFDLNYEIYSIYLTGNGSHSNAEKEIIQYLVATVDKNIC